MFHVLHLNSLGNSYQYSQKSNKLKSGDLSGHSIDIFLSIHLSGNNTDESTFLIINFLKNEIK